MDAHLLRACVEEGRAVDGWLKSTFTMHKLGFVRKTLPQPPWGQRRSVQIMSHHHMRRRLAALAAAAGASAMLASLAAAGPAAATVPCQTVTGYGSGATLASAAMSEVWLAPTGWAAHTNCATPGKITYTKTSNGAGLEEFGNGTGVLQPQEDPTAVKAEEKKEGILDTNKNVLDWFVMSSGAPSAEELGYAQEAAQSHNEPEVVVPVAQTPVAVLLSLPPGCEIEPSSELDLNNTSIGQLWEGVNKPSGKDPGGIQAQGIYAADTWGAFLTQLGYTAISSPTEFVEGKKQFVDSGGSTGCEQSITPQAFKTRSGTAESFKQYLGDVNRTVWHSLLSEEPTWPSGLVVFQDKLSAGSGELENSSNTTIAENTSANPGSVGFSNTAEASKHGGFSAKATKTTFGTGGGTSTEHEVLWAEIQNDGTGPEPESSGYADPLIPGEGHAANCETSVLVPNDQDFPYSWDDSWQYINTTDPNIRNDAKVADYPICALVFGIAWHHYQNPGLFGKSESTELIANTIHDLFNYLTTQGQLEVQGHFYQRFPTAMAAHVAIAVKEIKY